MHESIQPSEQNGKHRRPNTTLNPRILVALLLGLTVVLAGCTGIGDFGGDGEDGDPTDTATGGDVSEKETPAGEVTDAPTEAVENSAAANNDGTRIATSDDAGSDDTSNGTDETTNRSSTDAAESNTETPGENGGEADVEPLDELWHNFTANSYVFEVVDAENGTGTVTFEPNESAEAAGAFASLYPIVSYEGDDSLEDAYTARSDQTGDPTTPVLYALSVGGLLGFVDQENLTVGYEQTATSNGTDVTTQITDTTSYGGVGCYATEIHADSQLIVETCNVPYTDDVVGIVNYPPYAAIYDENGEVVREVTLVEMRDADSEA